MACDYATRLQEALAEAQEVVANALSRLIRGKEEQGGGWAIPTGSASTEAATAGAGVAGAARQQRRLAPVNPLDSPVDLKFCDSLNISACGPTVGLSSAGQGIHVAAYNPLAWSREVAVRVPVNSSSTCCWKITGPEGEEVAAQLLPIAPATRCVQQLMLGVNATSRAELADAELVFFAQLPPLGYSTYFVEPTTTCGVACGPVELASGDGMADGASLHGVHLLQGQPGMEQAAQVPGEVKVQGPAMLGNGLVTLEFDRDTGKSAL